jgi:hypothetical protein
MQDWERFLLRLVLFPFKLFYSLIFKIKMMRPNEENWPPQKIGAYEDGFAAPHHRAKTCHYRMRSQHRQFDKTLHVWNLRSVTLSTAPLFKVQRVFGAVVRCGLLAFVSLFGFRLFLWPLGHEFDFGLGPALRKESATLFNIHAYFLHGLPDCQAASKNRPGSASKSRPGGTYREL